jgi:aryl-alcohol dehydrogenase-like predicted oxidoreductase
VPIEETWGESKKLQEEGKVKYLGISEGTADEIRRAHKVAKISALEIEFSPWTPDLRTNGILDICREQLWLIAHLDVVRLWPCAGKVPR